MYCYFQAAAVLNYLHRNRYKVDKRIQSWQKIWRRKTHEENINEKYKTLNQNKENKKKKVKINKKRKWKVFIFILFTIFHCRWIFVQYFIYLSRVLASVWCRFYGFGNDATFNANQMTECVSRNEIKLWKMVNYATWSKQKKRKKKSGLKLRLKNVVWRKEQPKHTV